jgi:endonuclease-8
MRFARDHSLMEGPSIVIATEELAKFFGKLVLRASGSSQQIPVQELTGRKFIRAKSWGKHLIMIFDNISFRIHFLMWGSYRINSPAAQKKPRLHLKFKNGDAYFYACSIRMLDGPLSKHYDWSSDTMSKSWNPQKALSKILQLSDRTMVCDVLLDQEIFAGSGNIFKNEVLFLLGLHPETRLRNLSITKKKELVKAVRRYAIYFYKWKKLFQLRKHWKIFRKKICPHCGRAVVRRLTGRTERLSHYCPGCQPLRRASVEKFHSLAR